MITIYGNHVIKYQNNKQIISLQTSKIKLPTQWLKFKNVWEGVIFKKWIQNPGHKETYQNNFT